MRRREHRPLFSDDENPASQKPKSPTTMKTPPATKTVQFFKSPLPSQDVRKDANANLASPNRNARKSKRNRRVDLKISVNVRTLNYDQMKNLGVFNNNIKSPQSPNVPKKEDPKGAAQRKKEESIQPIPELPTPEEKAPMAQIPETSTPPETPVKPAEEQDDLPKLNDEIENPSPEKDENTPVVEKQENSHETPKKQLPPVVPTGFIPYGVKKFVSLEEPLGIKPSPPRPKPAVSRRPSSSHVLPPPDYRVAFAATIQKLAAYEAQEKAKRRVLMFLPTAFVEPHLNASDVQMLYGRFKVSEVVPFYTKECWRLGYGVMSVCMERQTYIQSWAPNHSWKAMKMMLLRERKPELKDDKVLLYIRNNSLLSDAHLEALLKQRYHASWLQLCYDSTGEPLHQFIVEMSYEHAVLIKSKVNDQKDVDHFHKMRFLEILMPPPRPVDNE